MHINKFLNTKIWPPCSPERGNTRHWKALLILLIHLTRWEYHLSIRRPPFKGHT